MEAQEQVRRVEVGRIDPSPYQPRRRFEEEKLEELAASIRQHGFIQPLVLRPCGERYQLIAGERRFRAALRLGLREVPAIVRTYPDDRALEAALVENLQREEITVVEAARAYQRLVDEFHYSQAEIARQTGKSRVAVTNTLRLLQLPDPVLDLVDQGDLSEGHARCLLALPYPSLQVELAEWAVRNALTVRELERKTRSLADGEGRAHARRAPGGGGSPEIEALEDRLRRHFGTRVQVDYQQGRGALRLEFYTDDDLWRLLELLGLPEAG